MIFMYRLHSTTLATYLFSILLALNFLAVMSSDNRDDSQGEKQTNCRVFFNTCMIADPAHERTGQYFSYLNLWFETLDEVPSNLTIFTMKAEPVTSALETEANQIQISYKKTGKGFLLRMRTLTVTLASSYIRELLPNQWYFISCNFNGVLNCTFWDQGRESKHVLLSALNTALQQSQHNLTTIEINCKVLKNIKFSDREKEFHHLKDISHEMPSNYLQNTTQRTELIQTLLQFSKKSRVLQVCADNCSACAIGDPNQCTGCISGYDLAANSTCVCNSPKALTPNGSCIFCSPDCSSCSDAGECLVCNTGYQLTEGLCLQAPFNSSARAIGGGPLKQLAAISPGTYATKQTIMAVFDNSTDVSVTWLLFAKNVLPELAYITCQQLQSIVSSSQPLFNELPSSIAMNGTTILTASTITNSMAASLDFTGLRTNTTYNFSICYQSSTSSSWSALSINFLTKDNGYTIENVVLGLSWDLAAEINGFLCALVDNFGVSKNQIRTEQGQWCDETTNEIPVEEAQDSSYLVTEAMELRLSIFGDAELEQQIFPANLIANQLTSSAFINSFTYLSRITGKQYSIQHAYRQGSLALTLPSFATQNITIDQSSGEVFLTNIVINGSYGYLFVYVEINRSTNNQTDLEFPSSTAIIAHAREGQIPNRGKVFRAPYFTNEPMGIAINGLQNATVYNFILFATNQDVSEYAYRTSMIIFQAGIGDFTVSDDMGRYIFIGMEALSVVLIVAFAIFFFSKRKEASRIEVSALKILEESDTARVIQLTPKKEMSESSKQLSSLKSGERSARIDISPSHSFMLDTTKGRSQATSQANLNSTRIRGEMPEIQMSGLSDQNLIFSRKDEFATRYRNVPGRLRYQPVNRLWSFNEEKQSKLPESLSSNPASPKSFQIDS